MTVTLIPIAIVLVTKGLAKGLKEQEIKCTCGDFLNYQIRPEKCLGDLKRLAVTQTPVLNYQLELM